MQDLGRLLWLFGACDAAPEARPNAAERALIASLAWNNWRVLPWIAHRVEAWAGLDGSPAGRSLRDGSLALRAHARLSGRINRRLVLGLRDARVPALLLKGAATRVLAWPEPEHRAAWDLDLAVPPHALNAAEEVARALGFTSVVFLGDEWRFAPITRLHRAIPEARHYEICAMVREQIVEGLPEETDAAIRRILPLLRAPLWYVDDEGRLVARLGLDIHHGLDPSTPVEPLFGDARWVSAAGVEWPCPPVEGLALHATQKLLGERNSLHHLADLARLLPLVRAEGRGPVLELALRRFAPQAPIDALRAAIDEDRLDVPHLHALLLAGRPEGRPDFVRPSHSHTPRSPP